MAHPNPTAIKDMLTSGGGVPRSNKIKVGSTFYTCLLNGDTWETTSDAEDLISLATANVIKNGAINPDYTITPAGTTQVFQVARWQDPGGVWWCKLLDV